MSGGPALVFSVGVSGLSGGAVSGVSGGPSLTLSARRVPRSEFLRPEATVQHVQSCHPRPVLGKAEECTCFQSAKDQLARVQHPGRPTNLRSVGKLLAHRAIRRLETVRGPDDLPRGLCKGGTDNAGYGGWAVQVGPGSLPKSF